MSSIYDSSTLLEAVQNDDTEVVVSLLEPRVDRGEASELERMICGVLLLMPPFADYEAAKNIFFGLMNSSRKVEAAVWDAYRHAVLMPDDDCPFEDILIQQKDSSIAWHMLSLNTNSRGDSEKAAKENEISRGIKLFPFNVVEYLKNGRGASVYDRSKMWSVLCDLIVCKKAEDDDPPKSLEGMLESYWENLILGTRITSTLWHEYQKDFG